MYLLTKYYEVTKDEEYLKYAVQGYNFLKEIANNTEKHQLCHTFTLKAGRTNMMFRILASAMDLLATELQ